MLTVVLCALALGHLVLGLNPLVTTSQGTMKGQVLKSRDGRDFFSFTKIPYAKPPVGKLRFVLSEKADNWTGIWDATQPTPFCYQINYGKAYPHTVGQEDCLYLNIFSPNLTGGYPVIFNIHGGGFRKESANDFEKAEYFMDEDVVFVAPNYRLGTLGFISLENHVIPGNNGLKDMALALEWVKSEISAFGGDPNRITVVGESVGGPSADILCSAPRTNGLIKACVSQSGVGLSPWVFMRPGLPTEMASNLAKAVGCDITSDDIIQCLQSKPLEQAGNIGLMMDENTTDLVYPVLEPVGAPGALLTEFPIKGTNHSYPWLMGVLQDEGLNRTEFYEYHVKSEAEIEKFINGFNQTLISTYHLENRPDLVKILRERYFKNGVEPLRAIRNYYTEGWYVYPSLKTLSQHPGPTYFYKFNYTRTPRPPLSNVTVTGVRHASEMPYLYGAGSFFNPKYPDWPNAEDTALSKKLVKMWVNFARDQNPSIKGEIEWPHFQGQYFLDIQNYGIRISNWTNYQETLDFWKSIENPSESTTIT